MSYLDYHLSLCGFMGAGKSAVAHELAIKLNLPLIELDQKIAELANSTIDTIFTTQGEAAFRDLEQHALQEALSGIPAIISLGGGTPCQAANFALLKEKTRTIYLKASFKSCLLRTMGSDRPLLRRTVSSLEHLYNKRLVIYSDLASFTIDTDTTDLNQTIKQIIDYIESSGIYHG